MYLSCLLRVTVQILFSVFLVQLVDQIKKEGVIVNILLKLEAGLRESLTASHMYLFLPWTLHVRATSQKYSQVRHAPKRQFPTPMSKQDSPSSSKLKQMLNRLYEIILMLHMLHTLRRILSFLTWGLGAQEASQIS